MRALQHLAGHFLDVVAGLTTLKIFGRSKAQVQTIREVTAAYRRTTMATLRLAFLSSLVLELLASVAVALVAVSVGLRLLHGHLDLRTALFLLILAPEAYLPLRHLGTCFHASADGVHAAEQVFGVLDQPVPSRGSADRRARPVAPPPRGVRPGRVLPRPARAGPRGPVVRCRAGRDRRHHRAERLREVDPALGGAGLHGGGPRDGAHRRRRPPRPRPGRVARPCGLGAPASAPLRRVHCRQHPARATGRRRRAGAGRGRRGGSPRRGRGAAGRGAHDARRAGRGALGRRAPAGGAGPGLPPRRSPAPARRADGRPRRQNRGRRAGAIRRLAAGRTVLVVAHRPALVAMADRVVALGAGR